MNAPLSLLCHRALFQPPFAQLALFQLKKVQPAINFLPCCFDARVLSHFFRLPAHASGLKRAIKFVPLEIHQVKGIDLTAGSMTKLDRYLYATMFRHDTLVLPCSLGHMRFSRKDWNFTPEGRGVVEIVRVQTADSRATVGSVA